MRLFVCVRPPDAVLSALDAVVAACRPGAPEGVRWVDRDKWHVTLHFLGDVADPAPVVAALAAVTLPAPVEAELGPAVELLGRQVVSAPVRGLEELAGAVLGAVGPLGAPPEDRPFRGHVTLARLGRRGAGGGPVPCRGSAVAGRWAVEDLALVRSHLGDGPARYEDLFVRRVGPPHP
jgi:RNA 2',3'-cyclic 3'-phosphodiesterase